MDKEIELLSKLFTPRDALIVLIVIALFTALYTAAIKFFFERQLKGVDERHKRELANLQAQLSRDSQVLIQNLQSESNATLKRLEAELNQKTQMALQASQAIVSEEQARKQSRLDYEYEARKRLYHECEPLIFELLEFSENAADRIRSLARTARQGNLPAWLAEGEYYSASTMYYLLAPIAVYKLMRRRLTVIDLTLDTNIATHYTLAKQLAWTFTEDFSLAWGLNVHPLEYDPHNPEWKTLRGVDEAKHWRQGLPYGRLDNAVEAMIVRDHEPDGSLRLRSFGEFETALHKADSVVCETFTIVRDIFTGFHPAKRPVLWRILIAQAHIYSSIVEFHRDHAVDVLLIHGIASTDRQQYYWERMPNESSRMKMEEPFTIADAYFRRTLRSLWSP
jgi:hypothetical protein